MEEFILVSALWVMVSTVLVVLMQGGFILLEAGSTRMKNAGHVAGKTIFCFGIASLVWWAVGYGFSYGETIGSFIGSSDFFFGDATSMDDDGFPLSIDFVFQLAFAGIALTIALGGFIERAKLSVYLLFSLLFSAFVYPIVAHWIWGDGWLAGLEKQDFAGSTVVHLTGAMAALAATILLKPRLGKYKNGKVQQIEGHNQVYTVLGVLILWVGWFGFNAGSAYGVDDGFFGFVALNTQLAAAAGGIAALLVAWAASGKADVPTMLNGALAGLVAITASCAFVDPWAAVMIGIVGGAIVYFSMKLFDAIKVDDPVFVLSVHGVAGVWGTLSTGLFATPALAELNGGSAGLFYGGGLLQLGVQTLGVVTVGIFAFVVSYVLLLIIKAVTGGLRVSEEQEIVGLDLSEHGSYGYPEMLPNNGDGSTVAPKS